MILSHFGILTFLNNLQNNNTASHYLIVTIRYVLTRLHDSTQYICIQSERIHRANRHPVAHIWHFRACFLTRPGAFSAFMAEVMLAKFFAATAPIMAAPKRTHSVSLGRTTGHPTHTNCEHHATLMRRWIPLWNSKIPGNIISTVKNYDSWEMGDLDKPRMSACSCKYMRFRANPPQAISLSTCKSESLLSKLCSPRVCLFRKQPLKRYHAQNLETSLHHDWNLSSHCRNASLDSIKRQAVRSCFMSRAEEHSQTADGWERSFL